MRDICNVLSKVSAPASAAPPRVSRVLSIDLLRGLDVLLMLFVNEVAGVRGAPAFLLHEPADADGMTLTDVVFPAFLFILGMAIPFALGGRLRRGDARSKVWRHVLTRTGVLLVMGVLMVNAEKAADGGVVSRHLWNVLMTVGVVLVWQAPAHDGGGPWRTRLRVLGVALLIVLALAYRSSDVSGLIQLRPHWWGILGLIGWAYLVSAGLYLLAGERTALLLGFVPLLYCLYLADEAGRVGWLGVVRPFLNVGRALGSHAAVALAGTVLGVMLIRHLRDEGSGRRLAWQSLGYGAGLAVAGLLLHALHELHPAFRISKLLATAPWCLLSSALTCFAWLGLFVLVDLRSWRRWPKAVSIAGENPLVAYFMAPLLLSLFALSAPLFGGTNPYEALGASTWVGLVRSALFAWIVVRLCGWMRSRGVRMQL
jgi:predicted acyltransferase